MTPGTYNHLMSVSGVPGISRRGFLSTSSLLLAGCAARRNPVVTAPEKASPMARLARVKVSPDRVIRAIAGLRPYRPSGFVVRGEKLDSKTVIHNYGHGGAGITLSWGTSQLAVEEGAKTGERECAVIGCGVVGLSTARLLQQRGYNPVIYTKATPPSTTSNVAGGLWEPVTVFDQTRVTPDFRKQFTEASRFAFRRYQSLAGDWYGVRWLPPIVFRETRRTSRRRPRVRTATSSRCTPKPDNWPAPSILSTCPSCTDARPCLSSRPSILAPCCAISTSAAGALKNRK